MVRCYKCNRDLPDGVKVMRPIDPPGTDGRRWACEDHFDQFADPEVESLVSIILREQRQ